MTHGVSSVTCHVTLRKRHHWRDNKSLQDKKPEFRFDSKHKCADCCANLRRREWNRSCFNSRMEALVLRDPPVLKEQI